MSIDLNNELGFPSKYTQTYFRSWNAAAVTSGMVNGAATAGTYEISGNGLSVASDDAANGTKILIKEAGLYWTSVTFRSSSGTGFVAVYALAPNNPGSNTTYALTVNEVCGLTQSATGLRQATSGIAFLKPGQLLYVSSGAVTLQEFTWQIAKIGPAL